MKIAILLGFVAVVIVVFACTNDNTPQYNNRGVAKNVARSRHTPYGPGRPGKHAKETNQGQATEIMEVDRQFGSIRKTIVIAVRGLSQKLFLANIAEDIKNEKINPLSNIQTLMADGVYAPDGITPAFPVTPASNLFTMVTGQNPAKTGVVADEFYDSTKAMTFGVDPYTYRFKYDKETQTLNKERVESNDWGKYIFGQDPERPDLVKPIWETMPEGTVACIYWPGCEFGNLPQGHSVRFEKEIKLSWEDSIYRVKHWLDAGVKLILIDYRDLIDVASKHGPDSPQVNAQLQTFDNEIAELAKGLLGVQGSGLVNAPVTRLLNELNLNLIIVGSSGMQKLENEASLSFTEQEESQFEVWAKQPSMWLVHPVADAAKDGDIYNLFYKFEEQDSSITVEKSESNRWNYNDGGRRIPGTIVIAKPGYRLSDGIRGDKQYGDGYEPFNPYMPPAFIAYGPSFKPYIIDKDWMGTVTVHLVLCKLMDVNPPSGTDSVLPVNWVDDRFRVEKYITNFLF